MDVSEAVVRQSIRQSLLGPHAPKTDVTLLAHTSNMRANVEQCGTDVLKWLKKQWMMGTV
jgi:hypothetical protein